MNASDYLDQIVEPTLAEYEREPTSVRRGFLACVAVFHTVDYLAHPKSPSTLRQSFRKQSSAFALIDRIAHAFKHVETGKASALRASDVISRPPAIWDKGTWDLSRWDDPIGGATLDQQREMDLLSELKSAVQFLRTQTAHL